MEQDTLNKHLGRRYLYVGLVILLIVVGGVSLFLHYNASTSNPPIRYSCNGKVVTHLCANLTHPKSSTAQTNQKASPSTPKAAVSTNDSTTNTGSSPTTQLSNTGPGNVILLFVVVTLASSFLHSIYKSRQSKLSGSA